MSSPKETPQLHEAAPRSGSIIGSIEFELVLLSLLSLFAELMIIRWLATEMRIFAYFKNLPLMAAFLGLGLGFIWTNRKTDFMRWSALSFLFLCGLLIMALALHLTFLTFVDPFQFMLFGVGATGVGGAAQGSSLVATLVSLLTMLSAFALATLCFVGFGQRIGQLFDKLPPLKAYSLNVFGALLGTVLFSTLCWFSSSPACWMILVGLGLILWRPRPAHFAVACLGIVYGVWLASFIAQNYYGSNYVETLWSPYYRIDLVRQPAPPVEGKTGLSWGYTLYINYDNFQQLLDCSPENLARFPQPVQEKMRFVFERPFRLFGKAPQDVLILGAGNGSDPAAAVRCGVANIDAVEIDPGIVALGKSRHPEHPYENPHVTLHVGDARTFLKTTDRLYDLILFAYVDSHAAFSSLSSLRMDNYLFTQQSLDDAARHLKKNGVIVITFLSMADWLWDRHSKALANATGMTPMSYCQNNGHVDVGLLAAGPGVAGRTEPLNVDMAPRRVNLDSPTPVSTDDWPFLFLPRHEIPTVYMLPIISVLLLGFCLVAREFKQGVRDPLNWQMFLTGMGFMMLEVRSMSALSLLFGSTWLVNSAVISGVMIVILAANFAAMKLSSRYLYGMGAALVVTLIGSTIVTVSSLAQLGEMPAQITGTIVFLSPMLFASVIFALLFKNTTAPTTSLAFNIVGGLVGVCVEYASMLLGLKALGWIGVLIYAGVLALEKGKKSLAMPVTESGGESTDAVSQ